MFLLQVVTPLNLECEYEVYNVQVRPRLQVDYYILAIPLKD